MGSGNSKKILSDWKFHTNKGRRSPCQFGDPGRNLGSSWDRQQMFVFEFPETSQIFELIKTTFICIYYSNGGILWKNPKHLHILCIAFFGFFQRVPLWRNENKSCMNEFKFREVPGYLKTGICWKFQLSISLGSKKSP